MVRITAILRHIPAIKFRKGGLSVSRPAAAAGSPPVSSSTPTATAAQAMSTRTLADIDMPQRYRRQPPSAEEIACINGGGIV